MDAVPIVLIPGLGADARLFGPQLECFGSRVHVPGWPEPGDGDDCAAYADRIAASLPASVREARPVLAGMSFGGQLAVEMSRTIPATAVGVIAGCRRPEHLPRRFALARRGGAPVPAALARPVLRGLSRLFARRERLDEPARRAVRAMAGDIDPGRLRRLGRVCATWPPSTAATPACPVHALHGDRDWVIPLVPGPEVTVVAGGRHLLPLTYPARVNAWLAGLAGG